MEQLHNRLNDQKLEHFMVLEGGGPYGIGYEAGILDEFRDRGADGYAMHALGTSAGSWVASMMATGKTFDDVANQKQIRLFDQTPDYMLGYAREIFGEERSGYVNATASQLAFPKPKLEIFNGAEHDLAHMVTMSSSVPFLFAPARYQGERYWDGAVAGASAGYAHLAPKADTLICITALATHLKAPGPFKYLAGPALERKSRHELGRWQKRNPDSKVIYIRPNRAINELVASVTDIFDFEIAKDVYWMAREQAADMIDGPNKRESIAQLAARLCVKKPA